MTARLTGATMAVALDLSHEGADTIFDVHCWDARAARAGVTCARRLRPGRI